MEIKTFKPDKVSLLKSYITIESALNTYAKGSCIVVDGDNEYTTLQKDVVV